MQPIRVQRVYDEVPRDGTAVLVDGVWPRGMTRERLAGVRWLREVAPSAELRRWFGHRPERWEEFRARYRAELQAPPRHAAVQELAGLARAGPLTLLYSARDTEHNQAVVIREVLEGP